nr:hypothetical protein DA06_22005 [Georgenia sp. SUBG003]
MPLLDRPSSYPSVVFWTDLRTMDDVLMVSGRTQAATDIGPVTSRSAESGTVTRPPAKSRAPLPRWPAILATAPSIVPVLPPTESTTADPEASSIRQPPTSPSEVAAAAPVAGTATSAAPISTAADAASTPP